VNAFTYLLYMLMRCYLVVPTHDDASTGQDPLVMKYRKWLWVHYVAFLSSMLEWLGDSEHDHLQVAKHVHRRK
jgi:hypothetical protein